MSSGGGNGTDSGKAAGWVDRPEPLLTPFNIAVFLIGILCFFGGFLVQQAAEPEDRFLAIATSCFMPAASGVVGKAPSADCEKMMLEAHEAERSDGGISLGLALAETMKALGVAASMSILISSTLERSGRRNLMTALSAKAREISLNVFTGVFGNDHPPALMEMVKNDILQKSIIRDNLDVVYTLQRWTPPRASRLSGTQYVKVHVMLSTVTRNISRLKSTDASNVALALKVALPNPMIDELKALVAVTKVTIDGKELGAEKLVEINAKLQASLSDDSVVDAVADFGERILRPGECVKMSANYTMMKESEDTEVLRSLYTTQNLTLTVFDQTAGALELRARAIHPRALEAIGAAEGTNQWRISDIILPQQGIMVWWKQKPTGAAPSVDRNPA